MRDPKRIPALMNLIEKYWEKNPDLRFFQLVELIKHDINELKKRPGCSDLFYFEDSDLMPLLDELNK